MCEKKCIISLSPKSADIVLTKEYFILKGGHYQIINGYAKYVKKDRTILTRDILNIEYVTMRSKKLLKMFMILCSILFSGDLVVRLLSSVMRWTEQQWNMLDIIYNVLLKNENGINLFVFIVGLYLMMIILAAVIMFLYIFKPYSFLYISALGQTVAIEHKYYKCLELDQITQIIIK